MEMYSVDSTELREKQKKSSSKILAQAGLTQSERSKNVSPLLRKSRIAEDASATANNGR